MPRKVGRLSSGWEDRMGIRLDLLHRVTDEELRELSERNPGYQFERTADGRLIVTPTGGESGRRSAEVLYQLERWNRSHRRGVVFDSSTGFRLPDRKEQTPPAPPGAASPTAPATPTKHPGKTANRPEAENPSRNQTPPPDQCARSIVLTGRPPSGCAVRSPGLWGSRSASRPRCARIDTPGSAPTAPAAPRPSPDATGPAGSPSPTSPASGIS